MIVQREQYIENLIGSMHNGLVKVVTGLRRCGKSFLLNELFHTVVGNGDNGKRDFVRW